VAPATQSSAITMMTNFELTSFILKPPLAGIAH
jgi:hypothetical protein